MDHQYTRVYAEIDLDAIVHNMEAMKKNLPPETAMLGVVKTDGYGHGAVPVAQAIAPYVEGYAVATAEEALMLRSHGVEKWILILGPVHKSCCQELVKNQIRPVIFTRDQAEALSDAATRLGKEAAFHFAVDTGMGRIGMTPDAAGADLAAELASLPGIRAEGVFTHFARADETDKKWAVKQYERYLSFLGLLKERGLEIPIRHCANSAGIIDLPQTGLDLARAGISIYGLYPSDQVNRQAVSLRPALSLKSGITYVKEVRAGQQISYGGTFTAERDMRVATIPVGYGDGYPRELSGRGWVLINGKRAPILGRICMDQFMADVSRIPEAGVDTPVTLIGTDNGQQIGVEELSRLSGRFHYEFLCGISRRVPRVYLRGGRVVGTKDWFHDCYRDFAVHRF